MLVTGICGRLGKQLARVLHRERRVVGVDRRPFVDKPKDIEHAQVDIRRKKLKDVFRAGDIEAVVHLGVMHDPRASAADHHSWNVAGLHQAARVRRAVPGPQARRALERERLRPAAEQPAVSDRGSRRSSAARTSATSATSSRSTCSRRASSGSCPRPRPSSCGRCTSWAASTTRPRTSCASNPVMTVMGFDPMAQVVQPARRRARHRPRAAPGHPRHLQPRRARAGAALAAHQDPRPTAHQRALLARAHRAAAPLVAAPDHLPRPELDHIRFVCMVDDRRARQVLGFSPRAVARGDGAARSTTARW